MSRFEGLLHPDSGSGRGHGRPWTLPLNGVAVWVLVVVCSLAAAVPIVRAYALHELELEGIEVKPIGRETPLDYGAEFQTLELPVGDRMLQARAVSAAAPTARALLIFHGNGEAVSDWSRVQARLRQAGISSMVFDYSGFGNSTGTPSVANMHEDALTAYRAFVARWPQSEARYVLGHSLGNAVMLAALPELAPQPTGAVVHAGFTSAREMAVRTGLAAPWMAELLPDLWDNEIAITHASPALLVMHSDADEVIPAEMGHRLADAAGGKGRFVGLHGTVHDSLLQQPSEDELQPIIDFVAGIEP